ncbi:beta-amyrin 11-oxidase-like [Juglans microcarpa x Juglans regia]|uniref:beta-amyrin 11-oxidase-like n=1 Tax=Juglans microcarpa x Juglans regia TaxID=2249226 RepID=UPI001B7DA97E|nr:beta-amyrin 11-oxidase-like [Juglans microcarpa x Juglans regia]
MELNFLWQIVAVLLGGYAFVFWFLKKVNEWYYVGSLGKTEFPLPPGDMGWPFLGNMLSLFKCLRAGDPNHYIDHLISRYGKTGIYKTHIFGRPSIILCRPELNRRVLTNEETFGLGYPKSVFLLTGEKSLHNVMVAEHRRLRKLITSPLNGQEAIAMYIKHIEKNVIQFLDEWASMKKPIELVDELKKATFKITTFVFLGYIKESTFRATDTLFTDYRRGLMVPAINIPGFTFHKALKARNKLLEIIRSVLEEKKAMAKSNDTVGKKYMIDLLIDVEDEDGKHLDDEHIADLILTSLSAGFDGLSMGSLWGLMHLAGNPQVFKKAKEEQDEIVSRRPSTQKGLILAEIKQMHYLAKVVDEMLRMTNTLALFRKAKIDVSINGYTIPKGWNVLAWNGAVHMDPTIYENPKNFDPSRWENMSVKQPGAFMPFGAGSRLCPGNELAKLVMTIFLHYFLLNYKMERINPESPLYYEQAPLPLDNGLVRFTKTT